MAELKRMKMCAGCGSPFTPLADEDFCYKCRNTTSTQEADVVDYIRDHPGVSILEVSRSTNLSTKTLIRMAHEGRFAGLILNKDFGYPCMGCGKLIQFGTYCPECFQLMKKDVKKAGEFHSFKMQEMNRPRKQLTDDELFDMFYAKKDRSARTFSEGMQEEINSRKKKR